jgi:Serine carboxypeptidase S28
MFDDIAEELGAIALSIEHLFFGQNFPMGVSAENTTLGNLDPLTLNNVLLDSVALINWVKSTVTGAPNSQVVITRGLW